ncbi:hypothetical protein D3C87_1315170 [compost metagenome]
MQLPTQLCVVFQDRFEVVGRLFVVPDLRDIVWRGSEFGQRRQLVSRVFPQREIFKISLQCGDNADERLVPL